MLMTAALPTIAMHEQVDICSVAPSGGSEMFAMGDVMPCD